MLDDGEIIRQMVNWDRRLTSNAKELIMNRKLYSTFAMLSLLLMMAVVSVQAQSRGKIAVTIPFEFQIGNKTLPAGEYSVKQLTPNSMLVQSDDGQASALVVTNNRVQADINERAAQERLVFHQYGSQYFLSQVWLVRGGDGRELNKTGAERQAAKAQNLASGGAKIQKVEVEARAR
jgi:hypothetical protein